MTTIAVTTSTTTAIPTATTTVMPTATAAPATASMIESTTETESPVGKKNTSEVGDGSKATCHRVYFPTGWFSRTPWKRLTIKKVVLKGVQSVYNDLAWLCGSDVFDLAIVYTASGRHLHHTVRVAARNASEYSATLHVDLEGNVRGEDGKMEPFDNGGRMDGGSCDFNRARFEVI